MCGAPDLDTMTDGSLWSDCRQMYRKGQHIFAPSQLTFLTIFGRPGLSYIAVQDACVPAVPT